MRNNNNIILHHSLAMLALKTPANDNNRQCEPTDPTTIVPYRFTQSMHHKLYSNTSGHGLSAHL